MRTRLVASLGLPAILLVTVGCASGSTGTRVPVDATIEAGATAGLAGPGGHAGTLKAAGPKQWLSYHADRSRRAAVSADKSLDSAKKDWVVDLHAVVHNQPLVADGMVYAATEQDRVVALKARNGQRVWSRSLGKPLTNVDQRAGCGDIDPLGITSTPVIDPKSRVIYVVGEVVKHDTVRHELEGLSLSTGRVVIRRDVDPPLPAGEHAINLLQRASLAIANHRIYVGYGGNDGDCGNYHGWVVSDRETGKARQKSFEVASDGQGGAIWEAGGAPAISANGDVYVTTGNANPDPPQGGPDPKHYTESVVRLSPTLKPLASYKDEVAGGDEDLATGNPVLLPNNRIFAVGKTDIGYVLNATTLHHVASIPGVCGSDPDGGPAYDAELHRIFVPCMGGGIQIIDLKSDKLGLKLPGANSAPILIGNDVWAADYPQGDIYEYSAKTGRRMQLISIGTTVPNFATPSTALGLLLIGSNTGVTAFR